MAPGGYAAQLNVRMDRTLKEAGDSELASRGILPSQIVRSLWERLAQRGSAAQEIIDVLGADVRDSKHDEEIDRKLAILECTEQRTNEFVRRWNIDLTRMSEPDDDELKRLAWEEREEKWREAGII